MKWVDNVGGILKSAHSIWAQYLAAGALITPELIYYILEIDTNPRFWWFVALILVVYGILGSIVDQGISTPPSSDDDVQPFEDDTAVLSSGCVGVFGAFIALLVVAMAATSAKAAPVSDREFLVHGAPFVERWEGVVLTPYRDLVGVETVCQGLTHVPMRTYTKAECDALFHRELLEYRAEVHGFFTENTLTYLLPVTRDVAFTSLGWNIGTYRAGKSTATRRLNAGDIHGACQALTWWNKAGGRVIRGLVNRRTEERDLCLIGT